MINVLPDVNHVIILETDTRRTIIIGPEKCTVNGRPAQAISPVYATRVPEWHPCRALADSLAEAWVEIQKEFGR